MSHTITADNAAGSCTPTAIEGYEPSRASRNVITDLLDGSLGVAYIPPRPRSGVLKLLFPTFDEAFAAFNLHAEPTSFTLTSSTITDIGMTYALDGSVDYPNNPSTGEWWVHVGYQELT